ncbi:MAG: alpha/beta hydrolase [Thermoplasmata archaeon]|nr:alpha/beta hydrolase [Thermoplasmata archaeon]
MRRPWPVEERGDGRPVVFLHGYPLNHAMWAPQIESLSDRGRIILLDLPGYGLAEDWPVPSSFAAYAELVHAALVDHLRSRAVLVGHSFGGYLALALVQAHPELFEALVLADTRADPDRPDVKARRLAAARRLERAGTPTDAQDVAQGLLAPGAWEKGGNVSESVLGMVERARPTTRARTLRAIADRPDLRPALPDIRMPTVVIWGWEDRVIPPAPSAAMVYRIPGSRGVGIPHAGHLPSLEDPTDFDRPIRELLDRLPAFSHPPGPGLLAG